MKPTFKLPETKFSIVIWYRDNKKHEQLIETPFNSTGLIDTMLMKYHVGFSEIRAVKSVETGELLDNFRRG